ncbi:HIR complex subunit [Sporothrix stenoceras]|uniref:HIR complex subunit n=1 Tax=Sporothrix stenoceras TaxID=5173 RepID=A0ABR3YMQ1_9PEZI
MAREGTRSQTGHATPRVFATVDTAPVIARKKSTKTKPAAKPAVPAAAKPMGVTKKKAAPKKEKEGAVAKTKAAAKKVVKKAAGKTETNKNKAPSKAPPIAAPKKAEPVAAAS